jgi:1-acyl-sn-glycerol-3-phosphate acyltransferase
VTARGPLTTENAWQGEQHTPRLYWVLQKITAPLIRFFFAVRRKGIDRIPKRGGVILVSNHASNIDPVLVVGSVRRPVYHLAKHTLFVKPFPRWFFLTLGGQVPVNRDAGGNEAALLAGVRVLESGRALAIYPEGTRSPDGRVCRGRTGVARLALMTGVPVVPVAIQGAFEIWPKGKKFPRLFKRTRILVGEPRVYGKDPVRADDPSELRRITDELMGDLARLLGQSYDPKTAPVLRNE